jgi:hypothetical protein
MQISMKAATPWIASSGSEPSAMADNSSSKEERASDRAVAVMEPKYDAFKYACHFNDIRHPKPSDFNGQSINDALQHLEQQKYLNQKNRVFHFYAEVNTPLMDEFKSLPHNIFGYKEGWTCVVQVEEWLREINRMIPDENTRDA